MKPILLFVLLVATAARADIPPCTLQIGPSGPPAITGAERHFCNVMDGRIRRLCERLCRRYPQAGTCTRVCSGFQVYALPTGGRCSPAFPTAAECCAAGLPLDPAFGACP
jgi:hypothetical protein